MSEPKQVQAFRDPSTRSWSHADAVCEYIDTLTADRDRLAACVERVRTCEWSYMDWPESGSDFDTQCGASWGFVDGGIKENGVKFCQKCGGQVVFIAPERDDEDEDAADILAALEGTDG